MRHGAGWVMKVVGEQILFAGLNSRSVGIHHAARLRSNKRRRAVVSGHHGGHIRTWGAVCSF